MTNQASDSNPFAIWQEWLEKSSEFWSKLPGDAAAADSYQMWPRLFEAWADVWIKFFTQAPSPALLQRGQKLWAEQIETWTKALAQPMGAQAVDPYQMWRHMFGAWADAWTKFFAQAPSPDLFQRGQKLWSEQIETWTNVLAEVMGSEAYAAFLSQTAGQRLKWMENVQGAIHPQVEETLRLFNLPSRSQINRLLEQLAEAEMRLDDLVDQNRSILEKEIAGVQKRLDDLAQQNQLILKELKARAEGNVAKERIQPRRAAQPSPTPSASA